MKKQANSDLRACSTALTKSVRYPYVEQRTDVKTFRFYQSRLRHCNDGQSLLKIYKHKTKWAKKTKVKILIQKTVTH